MGASRATQPRSLLSFKPALGCNSVTVEASRQVALGQTGGRLTGPLRWSKRGKNLGVLGSPKEPVAELLPQALAFAALCIGRLRNWARGESDLCLA